MTSKLSALQPTYGYSLEQPERGKRVFWLALLGALGIPLVLFSLRLLHGPEQMQIWWESAKDAPVAQPQVLTNLWMTFFGISIVIWHSSVVKGWARTIACIGVGFTIAWFFEWLGTNFSGGGIFGPYHYSDTVLLGHFLGVPWVVALGWESFAYPAFYMVLYLLPSEQMGREPSPLKRFINITLISALGGLFCVVLDFIVDPISVEAGNFTWHVNGGVYPWLAGSGEPITNFLGWWICGFVMMIAWTYILQTTPSKRHVRSRYLDIYIPLALYATWFTNYMSQEILMQQRDDVIVFGLFGPGGVVLLVLIKIFLEKQGYQPNPLGHEMSRQALEKQAA